ncbi:MAG: chloride channel protein [Phycisphaerales bacterium JB037]
MADSLLTTLRRLAHRTGVPTEWGMILIGAVIGTLTAFGAIGFAETLHWVEDRLQSVQRSQGVWTIVVFPVVGMALSGVLIHLFASEARGHGVPQVMKALIQRGGRIKASVGITKVFASILTVGSGGSAGTEGPIVQIGATAGSVAGQRLKVGREQMGVFVGCGAAAGISSIFNAPIAGVFFVMEILLRDFNLRTFTPIVVASVFSAVTTQAVLGENEAIFGVSELLHQAQFTPRELPSYVLLGAICGVVAVAFNRLLHWGEDVYDGIRLHPLLKPITGALLLGVLGIAFVYMTRSYGGEGEFAHTPAIFGNGYSTIEELLDPTSYHALDVLPMAVSLLVLLVAFKMVATTVTLASGGSGGVFAPSLFLGAAAGAALGDALDSAGLLPEGSTPAAYALVGMAAVVAGTTHAPLTAILILFELTRNVYVVLPIMLAAIVATVVAQLIERDSIYTYKLRRAGVLKNWATDAATLRRISVASCDLTPMPPEAIYPSDPLSKLIMLHASHLIPDFPVVDQQTGKYIGLVVGRDLRTALIDREAIPLLLVAELMRTDLPTVSRDESLDQVMDKFAGHDVASLVVVSPIDAELPMGMITRADVIKRYRAALDEG